MTIREQAEIEKQTLHRKACLNSSLKLDLRVFKQGERKNHSDCQLSLKRLKEIRSGNKRT
jgi:hypothetical protein